MSHSNDAPYGSAAYDSTVGIQAETVHNSNVYLEVISFGESAVADEGAGDAGEGEEVVGLAFVA
ncbi:hypothetical protein ACFU6R_17140, partial [Streptomyces sp. NPDC057499]|uniref:hypothetical protein n=1 Tax=Streptomyces sp. NPDC057499 TaxID=3346150 RepID=UPI00368A4C16